MSTRRTFCTGGSACIRASVVGDGDGGGCPASESELSDTPLPRYKLRALFGLIDMRWDWPVDVNYHEAHAYCIWKTEQVCICVEPFRTNGMVNADPFNFV